jgi:hypothetical protein
MAQRQGRPDDDFAPITGSWSAVDEWLAGIPHGTAALAGDLAWSPVLSEHGFRRGRAGLDRAWRWEGRVSWLGGPAVRPLATWPRRPDRTALAHVAAVSLEDLDATVVEEERAAFPVCREGLPTSGYLEVFHDLVDTYGWEAADRDRGGWLVRWVPRPETGLADPPDDLATPDNACQVGILMPGWSSRPAGDLLADRALNTAAARVQDEFQRAWTFQRTGSRDRTSVPVTHLYGHGQNASAPARRVLEDVLPLDDGDEHRLVLDVESWTHLSGWFGDAASLEVWMRDSDLAARRFDRAWCLTRTD